MTSLVFLSVVALAGWFVLRRANELCAVRVADGKSHLVRGRAPARFLADVSDIVERAHLAGAAVTLRVVSESGSPCLVNDVRIPAAVLQQVRNATGQHTLGQFRSGRRA